MESLLERVMTDDRHNPAQPQDLLDFWNEVTKGLADEFGVCGKEEIASVLKVMPEYFRRQERLLDQWRNRVAFQDTDTRIAAQIRRLFGQNHQLVGQNNHIVAPNNHAVTPNNHVVSPTQ
jgi:hypothetical protein